MPESWHRNPDIEPKQGSSDFPHATNKIRKGRIHESSRGGSCFVSFQFDAALYNRNERTPTLSKLQDSCPTHAFLYLINPDPAICIRVHVGGSGPDQAGEVRSTCFCKRMCRPLFWTYPAFSAVCCERRFLLIENYPENLILVIPIRSKFSIHKGPFRVLCDAALGTCALGWFYTMLRFDFFSVPNSSSFTTARQKQTGLLSRNATRPFPETCLCYKCFCLKKTRYPPRFMSLHVYPWCAAVFKGQILFFLRCVNFRRPGRSEIHWSHSPLAKNTATKTAQIINSI